MSARSTFLLIPRNSPAPFCSAGSCAASGGFPEPDNNVASSDQLSNKQTSRP
jgi:coenzyme F420-reducing hydrogenase gamma subunit